MRRVAAPRDVLEDEEGTDAAAAPRDDDTFLAVAAKDGANAAAAALGAVGSSSSCRVVIAAAAAATEKQRNAADVMIDRSIDCSNNRKGSNQKERRLYMLFVRGCGAVFSSSLLVRLLLAC